MFFIFENIQKYFVVTIQMLLTIFVIAFIIEAHIFYLKTLRPSMKACLYLFQRCAIISILDFQEPIISSQTKENN